MSADTRHRLRNELGRRRRAFRAWRWQRPFWGGLLTLLAGLPIMYVPYHELTLGTLTIRMSTTAGAGSLIIGVLLVVLGLTMWFQPQSRVFAGIAAILLSLVSLVVSNFGAFLVGFLLGLLGGALGVSWAPGGASRDGDPVEAEGGVPPTAGGTPGAPGVPGVPDELSLMDAAAPGEAETNGNGRHRAG